MSKAFDAIVVATITSASKWAPYGQRAWQATAKYKLTVSGKPEDGDYTIDRTGQPAACDDGVPMPAVGDDWVIYLTVREGRLLEGYSYPLNKARLLDVRLRNVD